MTICGVVFEIWGVILVFFGCAISGFITWYIVQSNRKTIERNNCINIKNELLRGLERRALYIWNGKKKGEDFDLDLEHSHILLDIKRIGDKYKELGKGCNKKDIPSELRHLRIIVAAKNIDALVISPDTIAPEELSVKRDEIRDLTEILESIPQKKQ